MWIFVRTMGFSDAHYEGLALHGLTGSNRHNKELRGWHCMAFASPDAKVTHGLTWQ